MVQVKNQPTAMYIGSHYDSRFITAGLIMLAGFEVVRAYHDKDIAEQIEKSLPLDLVVLDSSYMSMCGEDPAKHIERYIQLKSNPKTRHAPLVLITMENEFDDDLIGRLGADQHVIKPVDVNGFIKLIEDYRKRVSDKSNEAF